MIALYLLTISLTQGQTYERPEFPLRVQLTAGQELVYRGTSVEQSLIPGVQHQRQYALEAIYFVHNIGPNLADAVLQTTVSMREPMGPGKQAVMAPGSVRLDLLQIDRRGRLLPIGDKDMPLSIPLNGPALLESGAFFETPIVPVNRQAYWEEFEDHRPLRGWRMLGVEAYRGVTCVKLQMTQQSSDWNKPRADSTAWRRQDLLWFGYQTGQVFHVERTIERREPARTEPTQRIVTIFDLESMFRYDGRLADDRKEEIVKVRKFQVEARPLLQQPASFRPQIEALLGKITGYTAKTPPTPYRKTLVHLQSQLERSRSGEVPVSVAVSDLTDLTDNNSCRFYDLLGRPILVFYYNPTTRTGKEVLRFAQSVLDQHGDDVRVLGMAVSDDLKLILKQYEDMDLRFRILDGKAMLGTFGVDGTPRVIVVDGKGVVHCAFTGWGYHSPDEVNAAIRSCLPDPRTAVRGLPVSVQKKLPNIP